MNHLAMKIHDDKKLAPRYDAAVKELQCDQVVITEKGTDLDLPIVDFQLTDRDGNKYYFCTTGRLCNALAGMLKGINMRNHGKAEP